MTDTYIAVMVGKEVAHIHRENQIKYKGYQAYDAMLGMYTMEPLHALRELHGSTRGTREDLQELFCIRRIDADIA